MEKKNIEITEEKLEELKGQTKDKFTKKIIADLKKQINSNEPEMFKRLNFLRIIELIEHENKGNKLDKFRNNKYKDIAFELEISLRSKKRKMTLNGEFLLNEISNMIQKEFDLEPMHLYEFQIGKYKFGPECDEWQEIFDSLDDYKLGSAISAAGLDRGDKLKFLYDFGDKILFSIKILDVKKSNVDGKK